MLILIGPMVSRTPALATCQPRCESAETIPLSPSIIHTSDEELGCPGNYRLRIIAQWAKFQGNLQKRESGVFYTNSYSVVIIHTVEQ